MTENYGRFLTDVFCLSGSDDAAEILAKGRYLNQELPGQDLAVPLSDEGA